LRYKKKLKAIKRAARGLARRWLGALGSGRAPTAGSPTSSGTLVEPGGRDFRPGLPTIILVSHEATRTGAPIIALQLALDLSQRVNLVCWTGKPGPLAAAFRECGVAHVPQFFERAERQAILHNLKDRFGVRFAILNSVVSHVVMEEFGEACIPMVLLMHEFTEYIRPRGGAMGAVLRADAVVVPAEIIRQSLLDELDELRLAGELRNIHVRHQGICDIRSFARGPGISRAEVLTRIGAGPCDPKPAIVLGAGWVQPRKGLDLFIETARIVKARANRPIRFVWVGANFQPGDTRFGVYLADQLIRSDLAETVYFFEEQPHLEMFFEMADIFFLSSRLDPYPNVALEAIASGMPVVCFDRATGVTDLAEPDRLTAVPYNDCVAAAQEILRLAGDPEQVRRRLLDRVAELNGRFDHVSYARFVYDLGERIVPERKRQLLAARQRAGDIEPTHYAAGLPNWALGCLNGSVDTECVVRRLADSEISGLVLAQTRPGGDGDRTAGGGTDNIEIRPINGSAAEPGVPPALPAEGVKAAIHLYVDRMRSAKSLERLLRKWTGLHIFMTCGDANLAGPLARLARRMEGRCSLITEASCADPALALLTAIRTLKSQFDLIGNLVLLQDTEEARSFGRSVAKWHQAFMSDRAVLSPVSEAFALDRSLGLAFLDTPRVLGSGKSERVARALAASVCLEPTQPGLRFPLDMACWVRPSLMPQLSDPRLSEAARNMISRFALQHRIDGFSRFLSMLCQDGAARGLAFAVPSIIEENAPRVVVN
jgi:glycosyltransferase involved in cell wall biosynthesis